MAGESVVGALRVVLGLDTGSFEDGAKKAAGQLSDFGTTLKAVFGGTTLSNIFTQVFDHIIGKFKEGITHALNFADEMGKTAQKVGVSVETLSSLRVAAELSNVSMESLSAAMGRLSRNVVEATNKGGLARETFVSLGISMSDIKNKSPAEVLALMADRFANSEDGAKKTAAALNLMGRGGKDLIPLLNEGSNSLGEFTDLAQRMGLVVSKDTAAQATKFNDDLKILKLSFEGLTNQIYAQLLPTLVNLGEQLTASAKSGEGTKKTADRIAAALREFIIAGVQTVALVGDLYTALVLLDRLTDTTKAPESFEEMARRVRELGEAFKNISPHLLAIREALSKPLEITVHKEGLPELGDVGNKVQLELDKLALQARVLRGDFDNLALGLPQLAASLDLIAKNGSNLRNNVASLSPELLKLNTALQQVFQQKIKDETLTAVEQYNKSLKELEAGFGAAAAGSDAFAKKQDLLAIKLRDVYASAAQQIVTPMATAFKTLADLNKNFVIAAKAAAIAQATVDTYAAANKALGLNALLPGAGFAAAAAIIAAGLVNIAKIVAVPTAFATGGSFTVGGTGGIDSQLVAFNATPGEMVNVRKPGQTSSVSEITVNLRGRELLNRDMIRDLFTAINEGTRDGYRLKLAEV